MCFDEGYKTSMAVSLLEEERTSALVEAAAVAAAAVCYTQLHNPTIAAVGVVAAAVALPSRYLPPRRDIAVVAEHSAVSAGGIHMVDYMPPAAADMLFGGPGLLITSDESHEVSFQPPEKERNSLWLLGISIP